MWHFEQQGSGRPLVLLHGVGMSHAAWSPVMSQLAAERHVIAFDIAGFGDTPPLASGTPPNAANLLGGLVASLQELSIPTPVDIAGNSLGGYLAIEAAKAGLARSVAAISPAGLWKDKPPMTTTVAVYLMYTVAKKSPAQLLRLAMTSPTMRELLLLIPLSAGSRRMSADDAIHATEDAARATAFEETLRAIDRIQDAQSISVPLTIAFGELDWILPRSCQHREELPPDARWINPPAWGHVPMWVDPEGVASLILEGTA